MTVIGVDFGTTNSVVTELRPDGSVSTVRHAFGTAEIDVIRSVLCFWNEGERNRIALRSAVGPAAIEAYLDDPLECRLMMSLKSYLAQRSFSETRVFGRPFTLDGLIGLFLRAILPGPSILRPTIRYLAASSWWPGGRCASPERRPARKARTGSRNWRFWRAAAACFVCGGRLAEHTDRPGTRGCRVSLRPRVDGAGDRADRRFWWRDQRFLGAAF